MAQVKVRVYVSKEFEVLCSGETKDACLDDIADRDLIQELILAAAYDRMEVSEVITLDEPEPSQENEA